MTQPPQDVISGDSAQQRRWIDTTRTREAPSTAGGSRGRTRSLPSALELVYRPSLLDGRRLNVEWDSCEKYTATATSCSPGVLRGHPMVIPYPYIYYARAVSRQAARHAHALPRPSCACQQVVEKIIGTSSQRFKLLLCSSSTLGVPYLVFLVSISFLLSPLGQMKCENGDIGISTSDFFI